MRCDSHFKVTLGFIRSERKRNNLYLRDNIGANRKVSPNILVLSESTGSYSYPGNAPSLPVVVYGIYKAAKPGGC